MRVGLIALASLMGSVLLYPQSAAQQEDVSREIDRLFAAAWEREKLTPSERSDDAEFLRRLSLDLIGRVPSSAETVEFLQDPDREKRSRKIEELLSSPSYAKNWALVWQNRLLGRDIRRRVQAALRAPFESWLEKAFAQNLRYDVFVRELIAAEGVASENGNASFVVRWLDGNEAQANLAGQSVRLFMGIRLQCAQCHDHPYEKWTQEDFWGVAAYFARAKPKPIKGKDNKIADVELVELRRGEVKLPGTQKTVEPKFIAGAARATTVKDSRRAVLADLITAPENTAFPKALVNWMWAHFFGRGFVNPVDDFTEANPPLHPEVLELLSKDIAENGYDLKRLIRILVNTEVYQRSSRSSKDNSRDRTHFSKALVRPMSPEQLFHSLVQTCGVEGILRERAKRAKGETLEKLMDQSLQRFVFLFDNDEMSESLDFEATITQALFLMNGRFSSEVLPAKQGPIAKIVDEFKTPGERVEALYLTALARTPTDPEKRRALDHLRQHGDKLESYVDIFWTTLNSTEFFFNH